MPLQRSHTANHEHHPQPHVQLGPPLPLSTAGATKCTHMAMAPQRGGHPGR